MTAACGANAAVVGSGGYTNSFSEQPAVGDWSTATLGSGAGGYTTAAGLDADMQGLSASSLNQPLNSDAGDPPAIASTAVWSSSGGYAQTRATSVGATLLMCSLINGLGVAGNSFTISYDYAKVANAAEEVEGHRAFYSFSGAPGSWQPLAAFSSASPGRLSATVTATWANGGTLYIVWGDDNGSPSPDTANQIDNFSVTIVPASHVPASITNQPQSRVVAELSPVSFSVGVAGFPTPTVQWMTNGVAIPGATSTTYSIASTPLSYHGMEFRAVVQNVANGTPYSVTSSVATLSVNADTARPVLLSAAPAGLSQVIVNFSEPVTAGTATNLSHYAIASTNGSLIVSNAVLDTAGTNVVLSVSTMTPGTTYTLVANNVADRSAAANTITNNSQVSFTAAVLAIIDIGNPPVASSVTALGGESYRITAGGRGIEGNADQFAFTYQQVVGNFDYQVRVGRLDVTDASAKAALMARESLTTNSVFAASVATPVIGGSFFQVRPTTGANATNGGAFPANYPNTWLRLSRSNNVFTSYASADGRTWVRLGAATLNVGAVYLGFGVSSRNASLATSAEFFGLSNTDSNAVTASQVAFASEPLAAASRTTPLVISEIMFKPAANTNITNSLEFIEIYNSNPFYEEISGYRLSGDIDFTFPPGTYIQGGQFIVIAKDPAFIQSTYGLSGVFGPFSGSLPKEGTVRLRTETDAILLEVNYSTEQPWPAGADGTGHSLVLARASYGEKDPTAYSMSYRLGGSPGAPEPLKLTSGLDAVVINEFLAHTDEPVLDYVELYNRSAASVDISGCWLSDARTTDSTNKFQIPANTVLPASGFVAFNQTQLGFSLRAAGETIYLRSPDGTHIIDAVQYEAQENGVGMGRHPDGGYEFHRLRSHTPGTNNAAILVDAIVINEIMYGPISEDPNDQFVELYNQGTNAVDISGWRFTSGIDFTFPQNVVLQPGGFVVVGKSRANLLARYDNLNSANAFGDFGGRLSRDGERLAIAKPDYSFRTNGQGNVVTNVDYVVVDEVSYKPGGRWGQWADQGGSSLELVDPRGNHRMAFNWGDSDETGKAPWTLIEHTGRLDFGDTYNGTPIDRLEVTMLGEGECLLDSVEIVGPSGPLALTNPGFEAGLSPWFPQGNHTGTTVENNGGYTGTRSLRVKASGNGDTGANRIRVAIPGVLVANNIATIRAYARWQRGWPEILLRLKGNYLEAYGLLTLPKNLGTPGLPNSRRANAAPAIADVRHFPVLPAAQEPVVVSARVHDPDGVAAFTLHYRVDPSATFTSVAMNDNGTGGDLVARDGLFSGTIPGQVAGTVVAFYVQATDNTGRISQLPENAATQNREALVRFGEPTPVSTFAVYRMWLTANNITTYVNRPAVSNHDVDGTLVINNYRVIYNMGSRYGGSPYHQGQNSHPVTGSVHYQATVPKDDMYLGTDRFNKLHAPGNGAFDDTSLLREQVSFWFMRKMGLPYLYRRYFAMYVNGNRKGGANALMEDSQRPGGEMIDEFFPEESDGRLFKEQPWFEWDDVTVTGAGSAGFQNKRWCQLTPFISTNGAQKIAPYRYNWLVRSADYTANDYSEVFALVTAASIPPSSPAYWPTFSALVDTEHWAKTFAVQHAVGNWDSFGNRNSQNLYGYKPKYGKWKQFTWDFNIVLGNSGSDGPGANLFQFNGSDPNMGVLNAYPPFRRAWVRAYKTLSVGPNAFFAAQNVNPEIDKRSTAFAANGITPGTPGATVKSWVAQAQSAIATEVARYDFPQFVLGANSVTATSSNRVTVTGAAPLEVTDIEINGVRWPITWTTVSNWSVSLPVTASGPLRVVAYDSNGQRVGNTNTVTVNLTAPVVTDPSGWIIFNEIMYDPALTDGEYIELYNTHSNFTFDVSGWRIEGIDYTFPLGSYFPPRSFLVLAKSRTQFMVNYGAAVSVFDEFRGSLQGDGERLTLVRPATSTNEVDLIVDRVRYDGALPWPVTARGTGSSLQLIDMNQENARVANWFANYVAPVYCCEVSTPARTNDGWRFVSVTGSIGSGVSGTPQMRLVMYLGTELGSAIIDDLSIVEGTTPEVGYNYVRNGGFESPLYENPLVTNSWMVGTNYTNSSIVNDLTHSGTGALRLAPATYGNSVQITATVTNNKVIYQMLSPAPAPNSTNTLSFWFWATNSSTNLTVKVLNGNLKVEPTNINITITPSNYVPPQLVSPATNYATPGLVNQGVRALPAFQPLWINELQAENLTGIMDSYGEREPWIEIHNTSTNTVSLDGLYLTGNYTNLTNWAFPAGATIGPKAFLVVFMDGQSVQTSNTEYHASFRLSAASGAIALTRLNNGVPEVLDYVNYAGVHADRSYGSYPDGQPFDRQQFFYVTPRGTNDGRSAPLVVFINEWTASNIGPFVDPADNDADDWFEIYNPGSNAVSLAGYYLTDVLTNKTKFLITTNMAHVIPAGGHLLVWADNEVNQNLLGGVPRADLHVNFSLARNGEELGLFAADGTQIDAVSFGAQQDNVSQGRYPDGTAGIVPMPGTASPRAANYLDVPENLAPVLDAIGDKVLYLGQTLAFTATASDADLPAQVLTFSLDSGAPAGAQIGLGTGGFAWTPLASGTYTFNVRVTDSGNPTASDFETLTVVVLPPPSFASLRNGNNLELNWGTRDGHRYAIDYCEDLVEPIWIPILTNTASGASATFSVPTTDGVQRFYRIRTLD